MLLKSFTVSLMKKSVASYYLSHLIQTQFHQSWYSFELNLLYYPMFAAIKHSGYQKFFIGSQSFLFYLYIISTFYNTYTDFA